MEKNTKDFPKSFLIFNIPTEVANMILHQRIWSIPEITIEARPFLSHELPTSFLCLNSFTTSNPETVARAIHDMWTSPETLGKIVKTLEKSEIPLDRCYDATMYLCDSISVEFIDYKVAKAISLLRFNIFATCPSNQPKTWTSLHTKLMTIHYPTPLDGTGITIPFTACSLCHSIGHPNGLCKHPDIPSWNGPKHKNKATKNSPKNHSKEWRIPAEAYFMEYVESPVVRTSVQSFPVISDETRSNPTLSRALRASDPPDITGDAPDPLAYLRKPVRPMSCPFRPTPQVGLPIYLVTYLSLPVTWLNIPGSHPFRTRFAPETLVTRFH
ncbi:hypothetical protein EDB19DRAFT_1920496 [Suillus lakei]|nr:hypothetical protein EDB19DRAFT_1920496 [Suillus lakei]